jgi:hypothetical protein
MDCISVNQFRRSAARSGKDYVDLCAGRARRRTKENGKRRLGSVCGHTTFRRSWFTDFLAQESHVKIFANNTPMRFRKLRIAWSAVCGILCLLLIVLWVRSFYRYALIEGPLAPGRALCASSIPGRFDLTIYKNQRIQHHAWTVASFEYYHELIVAIPEYAGLGFGLHSDRNSWGFYVPYWCPISVLVAVAAIPWLRTLRFSLRTLLIVTTLLAVALGVAVWAAS